MVVGFMSTYTISAFHLLKLRVSIPVHGEVYSKQIYLTSLSVTSSSSVVFSR